MESYYMGDGIVAPSGHDDDAERWVFTRLRFSIGSMFVSLRHGTRLHWHPRWSSLDRTRQPLHAGTTVVGETPNFDLFTLAEMELGSYKGADKPVTAWQVIGKRRVLLRAVPVSHRLKLVPVGGTQLNVGSLVHFANSHTRVRQRIPKRIELRFVPLA
jgi:hypothetical protein